MNKRTLISVIGLGLFLLLTLVYIWSATNQKTQTIGAKATFTQTTCDTWGLKGAPPSLPHMQEDYKNAYCTDKTPQYSGSNKCYTKTLVCSTNKISSDYWCKSTACYSCYNEEVDLSLCRAGATDGQSICMINDTKWRASRQLCDFGSKKIEYDQCSPERYKCKCDDAGKYPYPVARFDTSCPDLTVPTNIPGAPIIPTVFSGTICQSKDAKWIAEKKMCDLGSGGKKLLYKTCTPDGYMCKCDDVGKRLEPSLQKDVSCTNSITPNAVSCDINPKLQIIKNAYDSGNYRKVYEEIKKNFELSNTQSKADVSVCYMPGAKLMSGNYCGKLQLPESLSAGCACVGLIEGRIAGNFSTFDYSRIKDLKTCELTIQQINTQLGAIGTTGMIVVPTVAVSTSVDGVNTTPSTAGYSYQGNKLPWNGYMVNTDNCLLQNNSILTGYVGDPNTLKFSTALAGSTCAKK